MKIFSIKKKAKATQKIHAKKCYAISSGVRLCGLGFCMLLLCVPPLFAQTARIFTLDLRNRSALSLIPASENDGGIEVAMLTCYLPEQPSGRAIVDCPGGGYSHLAMHHEGHDWASYFNAKGIAFFVLKYRMPNGQSQRPMSDACEAIRLVRDSAAVWNINPFDVGIMGFSAGGHLASAVSTHAPYALRPDFSILFYPVISMDERASHRGSVEGFLGDDRKNAELVREYSSDHAVRRHLTPPAIILLSNDDRVVPPVSNGIAYYSSMRKAGNDCSLAVYPTGDHGWGFREGFTHHRQMLDDLCYWLSAHPSPKRDAVRVACIGNSITDGSGINMADASAYPAQLQSLLGHDFMVKNFGVSGRTMLRQGDHPYILEQAWRDVKDFRPHIAIVKLGTNDSKPFNWKYAGAFQNDMRQMLDTLQSLGAKIFVCTPLPALTDRHQINDSTIVNGVIPAIEAVARSQKCSLIDLHTLFHPEDGRQLQSDGIHPTREGAAQMAKIIADAIVEEMGKKMSSNMP